MKTIKVTLKTKEVLDGVKRRPGEIVTLPQDHPVAVKTIAAGQPSEAGDAGGD